MLIRSCQSIKEYFVLLSIEWRVSLPPYRYQSLQPHQFRSQLWIFQVSRSSRGKFGPSYIPPKVTVVGGGMVPSFSSNGDRDVLLRRKNTRNFDNANKNTKWNPRTSSLSLIFMNYLSSSSPSALDFYFVSLSFIFQWLASTLGRCFSCQSRFPKSAWSQPKPSRAGEITVPHHALPIPRQGRLLRWSQMISDISWIMKRHEKIVKHRDFPCEIQGETLQNRISKFPAQLWEPPAVVPHAMQPAPPCDLETIPGAPWASWELKLEKRRKNPGIWSVCLFNLHPVTIT